ncbi:hypothetical protein [Micromonospora zhanjiangensis]|uniref:Uncharacterized protein n=1 Tax=Micromonospora zhanjiangensis TaxID=1522057 RepID=A0ABV8KPF9_9ACTN
MTEHPAATESASLVPDLREPAPLAAHQPRRPMWVCRVDAQPWPCASARLHLKATHERDPVGLSIRMAGDLHEAMRDLYRLNPGDAPSPRAMFDRFLAWPPFKKPVIPAQ